MSNSAQHLDIICGWILQFLFLNNHTKIDPSSNIELPRITKKIPDYLNIKEIERIFKNISIVFEKSNFKRRNLAIVHMLYGCGLRVSEVCEVKINNIIIIKNKMMMLLYY